MKSKKISRLMFHPIDKWNIHFGNALDVDMKTTWFAKCPKQVCFNEEKIVHATTAKIIVTARYMHIWHECIEMTDGKIMVRPKNET